MLRDATMAAMRNLCRSICEAEGRQLWAVCLGKHTVETTDYL